MTEGEAREIVVVIDSAWSDQPALSDLEKKTYVGLIRDLPLEQTKSVVAALSLGGPERRPSPRALRKHVFSALLPHGCTVDHEEAWSTLMGWFGSVGIDGDLPQEPALLVRVVKMLGWRNLCTAREDQMASLRAQFRDAYRAQQERLLSDIAVTGSSPSAEEIADHRRAIDSRSRLGMTRLGEMPALAGLLGADRKAVSR